MQCSMLFIIMSDMNRHRQAPTSSLLHRAVLCFSLSLACCGLPALKAHGQVSPASNPAAFGVVHYDAQIVPDIASKTLKGKVRVTVVSHADQLTKVGFDCGELMIEAVRENGILQKFLVEEHR